MIADPALHDRRRPSRRGWRSLAGALLAGACSGSSDPAASVAAIEVAPPSVTVQIGVDAPITARALDAAGRPLDGRPFVWSSADTTIATISPTGVVRGRAAGSTRVAVSAEGRSAIVSITVSPREVAAVQVTPLTAQLVVGATRQLEATALDATGGPLTGRTITWSSSNPAVADVDVRGLVRAVAPGAATITAASEGRTGSAAVTVIAVPVATVEVTPAASALRVGETAPLAATLRDAAGAVITGRTVVWSSSNNLVATVASTGVVTAVAPGVVTVTATSEGRSGTATVSVTPVAVASVGVSIAPASITVGGSAQVTATPRDAAGNVLANRAISYSSSNVGVATVSASGTVVGVSPGTATITATSEGRSGSATVTVTASQVAAVSVTPSASRLLPGRSVQLTAVATAANGAVLAGRPVTWTSGSTSVVVVSPDGLVTAVAPGSALVFAQVDGVLGSATVTVDPITVASVAVAPPSGTLSVGGSVQLSATARDALGNQLSGRVVTWSSSDETIARVSSTGGVTALRAGVVDIIATVEGRSGSSRITVVP